ncbi:MAG TPA: hypothetical protein VKQ10_03350, partial [Spirochaetota bacterium]|nr:hypothetical protein [Spirochaetota bacterium]
RNSSDELERNSSFNIKYIVHKDSCTGDIVWKGIHKVRTNEDGKFRVELANYDRLNIASFGLVDVDKYDLGIRVQNIEDDTATIAQDSLSWGVGDRDYSHTYVVNGEPQAKEGFDALITIYNRANGERVYQEKQNLTTDEQGVYTATLGAGVAQEANYDYYSFEQGNYCAEIVKPLDYTNPMLMLAGLGVLGILFAFLLKRDDKVSGYGLEQPNKMD